MAAGLSSQRPNCQRRRLFFASSSSAIGGFALIPRFGRGRSSHSLPPTRFVSPLRRPSSSWIPSSFSSSSCVGTTIRRELRGVDWINSLSPRKKEKKNETEASRWPSPLRRYNNKPPPPPPLSPLRSLRYSGDRGEVRFLIFFFFLLVWLRCVRGRSCLGDFLFFPGGVGVIDPAISFCFYMVSGWRRFLL